MNTVQSEITTIRLYGAVHVKMFKQSFKFENNGHLFNANNDNLWFD